MTSDKKYTGEKVNKMKLLQIRSKIIKQHPQIISVLTNMNNPFERGAFFEDCPSRNSAT